MIFVSLFLNTKLSMLNQIFLVGEDMRKILFLIPNLMHGGAEKVLINLLNNMDKNKFDITLQTLFDCGENKKFLKENIKYKSIFKKQFRGNIYFLKLFSPSFLYKRIIKDKYDIIVSYLEGPTARIVSGCNNSTTKLISWIHIEQFTLRKASKAFRSTKESSKCYDRFDKIICVSQAVKDDFVRIFDYKKPVEVLYNTNETGLIRELASQRVEDGIFDPNTIKICAVGKIMQNKGFMRLARIHKKLAEEGISQHIYILGKGPEKKDIEKYLSGNKLLDTFTFLGYHDNPYKYISKCNLFVCSSFAEGFSTAATEALILGIPVVTTNCAGMKEMLGDNDEYGIVTDNNEAALYNAIKQIIVTPNLLNYYKEKAEERGKYFSKENTLKAAEEVFEKL
jgi:glycosyltransferase involved in cell wall biosynthesis